MRFWLTILPTTLVVTFFLISLGCGSKGTPPDEGSKAESSGSALFAPIDFQSHANKPVREGSPQGLQSFQGVTYQIGPNVLQVGSTVYREFPLQFEGIQVGQTCRAIHFLHTASGGSYFQRGHPKHEEDGVEIGQYVMHYADGSEAIQPIVYGQHLRGGWDWDGNKPTTQSDLVWTGDNPKSGSFGRKIRFYWAVWENPHPEKPVATIDFISTNRKAAPFCIAMSLEHIGK